MMKFEHMFHLVSVSPWPLLSSVGVMFSMVGILKLFYYSLVNLLILGLVMLVMILLQWWRDVIRESFIQGSHTFMVVSGLRVGMVLFIISELFFFVSFFWAYFHVFLSPGVEMGGVVPSCGVETFNPYNIPLLNTLLLLSSGVSITLCHNSLMFNKYKLSILSIIVTIVLGMIFTFFQYLEYNESYFTLGDSVYGSIFFLATGFHGLHVFVGTLFILISLGRMIMNQFSFYHHFGFEAASWYWHFVDLIWLFLYIFIYWLSY